MEQKERQYTVADAATEQSYWPTDIMSAEVRDCWQNPKGCREPTKCNRGNTRKPSDSQRHDESHQSEENNVLDESHAAICCIMRQRWAPGSIRDYLLWPVFAILTIATVWTESEMLSLFVLSGLVAMLIKAPPRVLRTRSPSLALAPVGFIGFLAPAGAKPVMTVFFFFLKAGAFVFGSGLAIVPFLYGGVVNGFHWLTERQFLDAVAVAMITPGPVVITSGFIGYLVAGPLGAFAATLAVFLPPYLLVVFGAPCYRRFAKNRQVKAFVQEVTAAAVGAIAGAAIILSKRAIMDLPTVLIAVVSLLLLLRFKRIPEPLIILGAGIVGLTVKHGWS